MLAPGMKSRPVYPGLTADPFAKHNLIVGGRRGCGGRARHGRQRAARLLRTFDHSLLPDRIGAARTTKASSTRFRRRRSGCFRRWRRPCSGSEARSATATMGTRLYATGTEPFIGSVIQEGLAVGIDFKSIITEHRGSAKRACSACTARALPRTSPPTRFICAHCGLNLLVRDHYSRRLGAFQGVCIDAEVPGEAPAVEEIYK